MATLLALLPADRRPAFAKQLTGPPDDQGNYAVCNVDWGPLFEDQSGNWRRIERFRCNTGPTYGHGLRLKGHFQTGPDRNWTSWGTWNDPYYNASCGVTTLDIREGSTQRLYGTKCWFVGPNQASLLSGDFVQASPPSSWVACNNGACYPKARIESITYADGYPAWPSDNYPGGIDAHSPNALSSAPSVSADGQYVAFASDASNLLSGDVSRDTNSTTDIFVTDRFGGYNQMLFTNDSAVQANGPSSSPSISSDGRYVAFASLATNLVSPPTTGQQIFRWDTATGDVILVSRDASGAHGTADSSEPSISADGRYVAFESNASNLISGDTNNVKDVFRRDLSAGTNLRVSIYGGTQGNGASSHAVISDNGDRVAFASQSTNFAPGASGQNAAYVHSVTTGITSLVAPTAGGEVGNGASEPYSMSSGGITVAFSSTSTNLPAIHVDGTPVTDTNGSLDVFTYDLSTEVTMLVSSTPSNVQGNNSTGNPSISSNGQWVVFSSAADNLLGPGNDPNNVSDIFERDLINNRIDVLSVNTQDAPESYGASNGNSEYPVISADGGTVAYQSAADNLIAEGDENEAQDIFIHTWVQPNHVQCFTERGSKVKDETDTEPIPVPWLPLNPPAGKPDSDSRCQSSTPAQPFVVHFPADYAVFHAFAQPPRPDGVPLRYGWSLLAASGNVTGFGYYKILYKHGYGPDVEAQIQASLQVAPQISITDPTTETYVYAYTNGGNPCIRITVVQTKQTQYDGDMKGIITSYAYFNG